MRSQADESAPSTCVHVDTDWALLELVSTPGNHVHTAERVEGEVDRPRIGVDRRFFIANVLDNQIQSQVFDAGPLN